MRRGLAALLIVAATAAAGCGGGDDKSDVEQVIRDWISAGNERDGDRYCGDLVTDEFVEGLSLAKGDQAREECRDLLENTLKGLTVKVDEVRRIKIDGDKATAVVRTEARGRPAFDQTFHLVKEGGDFRITTISGD
jgi:ketosteroid isomerase-like protein